MSSVSSQQHSDAQCLEALQRRSLDPAESPRPRAPANVQAEQESAGGMSRGDAPTRTCGGEAAAQQRQKARRLPGGRGLGGGVMAREQQFDLKQISQQE